MLQGLQALRRTALQLQLQQEFSGCTAHAHAELDAESPSRLMAILDFIAGTVYAVLQSTLRNLLSQMGNALGAGVLT